MRTLFLIIAAELLAFMLGVLMTIWLGNVRFVLPAARPATPTAVTLSRLAVPPAKSAAQVVAQFPAGAAKSASEIVKAKAASGPQAAQMTAAAPPPAASSPSGMPAAVAASSASVSQATGSPDAATKAAIPEAGNMDGGAFILWFGVFAEPANAALVQKALQKYGYAATVVPYSIGGKVWRVVQLGGFADRDDADEAAVSVQLEAGIGALVTKSISQ